MPAALKLGCLHLPNNRWRELAVDPYKAFSGVAQGHDWVRPLPVMDL